MPILKKARYEAFAQARAKGARLDDAYENAGFVLHSVHPTRLSIRPEVAARIAELRAERADAEGANLQAVIAALMRMAKAGEASENIAAVKESRLALIDAARLYQELEGERRVDQRQIAEQHGILDTIHVPGPA
jgi:hypothetical protein